MTPSSEPPGIAAGLYPAIEHSASRSVRRTDPVEWFAEIIVALALIGEVATMFGNVILRGLFNSSLLWGLEASELALVVLTFVGGAIAFPRNKHMALQVVVQRLPRRWRPAIDGLVCWQVVVLSAVGAWLSWGMMLSRWDERTLYAGLSEVWFAIPMILGMALMAYFALRRAFGRSWRVAVVTGIVVAALLAVAFALFPLFAPQLRSYALPFMFTVFTIQCLLGVPIGFVLLFGSILYLDASHAMPLSVIPINLQAGISSFVMLAIPFFIFAGYLMTEGGLSRRLMDFIITLVGRFRGGMLQVVVITMYIMSGISGSKSADVAAVATATKSILREEGYAAGETAAVIASCAVMGEAVPPSVAMLVLASVTSLSIASLFVAGLLPAAVIALCLMMLIYFRSRGDGRTLKSHSPLEIARAGLIAIPALVAPLILIGGIVSGIATPTEVSSSAVVYALVLSLVFYRSIGPRQFLHVVSDTVAQAGMVLFITSAASTFSWSLTIAKLPQRIVSVLGLLHGSATLFMVATIVTLVLMGALLEGVPALLIFGPLLLPVATVFGIEPLQYGIVLIVAMGAGSFATPIGVGMFVTCSMCDTTLEATLPRLVPYAIVLAIGLLVVAFVPWFSLFLPRLLVMN